MSKNGSPYHKLLNTARWRALRAWQLARAPFCEDCLKEGVYTEATDVHHRTPIRQSAPRVEMEAVAYDKWNLVSLCRACHCRRHKEMKSHSLDKARERARREAEEFWKRFD